MKYERPPGYDTEPARGAPQGPKGGTKARCSRGALGLGANLAVAVLDVSETGARLVLKADLPKGQEVELALENVGGRAVKGLAEIVWSVALADGNFCVGAHFHKFISYTDLTSLVKS